MSDSGASENDVAIVGMALRVPGAWKVDEFWQNLRSGVESIVPLSDEDLLEAGESPELLRHPDYVRACGPLDGMELFDGEFFGFSPKESAILDPQHRHFTECCWEALEDAGHPPDKFDGQIGIFAGCGMGSYFYFNVCSNKELVDSVGLFLLRHTGNDKDFLTTRVSYLLDLKGPSINIQTACSTSLVATHVACQSLLSGESDLALAGGVTILFPHRRGYVYQEGEVLSPDGHCHAFDHRAAGTVLASGAAVVALRRLEDALADGDPVYAVIKGSAVNNDGGQKVGYLAPSVDGQTAAMVEAHEVADVDPASIGMIECHGTGTYMGDPIEISALTQAFRRTTPDNGFCRIGSVKTNIGHLDTAAGAVGLIKAALSLEREEIPPSLGYERPNPVIGFESTPFVVNDQLTPWPRSTTPRRAAVNSLGVGGTNAHAVLQEAPPREPSSPSARPFQLLTLSARNNKSLDGASKRLAAWLREHPEVALADVAYTLDVGRRAFDRRRVLAVASHEQAVEYLESGNPRRVFTHGVPNGEPSVAFMFSGAGTQYPRMAAELYEQEPVFREQLDRGLDLLEQKTGFDFRQLFFAPDDRLEEAREELEHTNRMLAAIFVTEYALARLWMSWGVEPKVMIGHSLGENTAACIAGVMSYEDCLDLVILRGQLTDQVAAGAMTSVLMAPESLRPLLEGEVDLAIVNGPELCVISGTVESMEEVEKRLTERDVEFTRLPIPRAGHSRMFDPILPAFRSFLESIELHPPKIPFVSNRTGKPITDEQATSPDYWVEHLRQTVFFSDGLGAILEKPGRILIEVGPGQTLSSFARQHPASRTANVVPSLRHRDDAVSDAAFFLASLGRVWASGLDLDFARLREGETRRRVRLPSYAWSHQPYFIEATAPAAVGPDLTRLERLENVRDWAYVPTWQAAAATPAANAKPETWLIFMDAEGVGRRLRKRLQARGHTVIAVDEGDAYYKRNDEEYSLAPERGRAGYDALIQDLVASGRVPNQIVHLWLLTGRERFRPGSSFFHQNLQDGFYSLFFLAQTLGDENVPRPLHVSVVSNGAQSIGPEDPVRYPEKATALGPVKVIPRELPGVTCKSIDVALPRRPESTVAGLFESLRRSRGDGFDLEAVSEMLERELLAEPENDVVVHRGGERRVRRFEKHLLDPPDAGSSTNALREGGSYLITGGLGGLGLTLAERLAREIQPRLVLVGRTGLPPREQWDAWRASRGDSDRISRCIHRVQQLEEAGAEVLAISADVTNLEQMREAVRAGRERFGTIHGIFHTAGVVKDELIQLKLESDVEEVFGPKIHGTLVLDALLEEAGAELLVLYSSTSAVAAPAGQIDYVAANAFLDAYAASRSGGPVRTLSINWGIWNQVGMAADSFERPEPDAADAGEPRLPAHPLFDARVKDAHGRTAFQKTYTADGDWVLDEHRTTAGHALLPGTGYPELARAALLEYGDRQPFEIRDLYFIRPLYVPDGESREVRVMLTPSERGYQFAVRTGCRLDGRPAWELNSQASIEFGRLSRPEPLDLQSIFDRCRVSRSGDHPEGLRSGQENHVRFGPRWRVLREVAYGDGEALARLELPEAFASDLDAGFGLHPALLDYATGYAMDLIEGYEGEDLWVPVSYGRIQVFGPLPQRIHSWVRNRADNRNDKEFAVFDVTITDPEGRVIVQIDEFTIKRLEEGVDFTAGQRPSRSDCEFDAALGSGDARNLSPAELQLRRNYERGIRPEEGGEALLRALAEEPRSQIVLSSLDLPSLVAQVELAAEQSSGDGARFGRPELDSEYVEPRDELERTLVGFWEELLGIDRVGVQDSFFDLGGHSLIAVRLFARIKKAYQVEFPISVLFEAPTIEGCAQLIREARGDEAAEGRSAGEAKPASESRRTRFKHLVAMHAGEGGPRKPFFLVAGMFGNVLNLRHLANLCGRDRPFYGIQARGLYGDEPPHETFEEMAEAYIEEMKQVQPEGPYLVGGFSGGGLTAFEIAHQLRAAGDEVGLLLLLDSRLPQTPALTFRDRAQVQWIRLKQRGPGYALDWARNRMRWHIEQLQARFTPEEVVGHTADQFHNQEIERAFRAALPRYRMKHWPGHLVLFRPKLDEAYVLGPGRVLDSMKEWVSHDNAFGDWCDSIEVHEMPGNHDSMVLEPNVRAMAAKLRDCIAAAEKD